MPPWSGSALYAVERGRRPRLRWLDRGEFRRRPLIHPPLLSFLPSPDFVGSPLPLCGLLSIRRHSIEGEIRGASRSDERYYC